jgi:heat shock protein HslJ
VPAPRPSRLRRPPLALAAAAILVVLAGCGDGGGGAGGGDALDGRAFLSQAVTGRQLVPGTQVRLSFRDGQVHAHAGCNSLSGPYRLRDGRLAIGGGGGMVTTEIGCDPERHAQDEWLAAFLSSSPTVDLAGADLTLATPTATIRLLDRVVADPDRPLVGTTWRVDTVVVGEAASSVPEGSPVTLQLPDGATFRLVSRGCTEAAGTVEIAPRSLRFGAFAVDNIGCPPPWEHTLGVLRAGEVAYRIEAGRLTLEAPGIGVSAVAEPG